jgi:XisH protein/XisI protein
MPAKDIYHDAVKQALIKDGWTITADPYILIFEDAELYADLAAERPISAQRQGQKIVVEIKSFVGRSLMYDFYAALGQYIVYRNLIQLAFDRIHDQYLWFRFGWEDKKKVQQMIVYICIKNGKIWVEEDATDLCIVDDLLAADIPKYDIILGFHHPKKRALTEFATA